MPATSCWWWWWRKQLNCVQEKWVEKEGIWSRKERTLQTPPAGRLKRCRVFDFHGVRVGGATNASAYSVTLILSGSTNTYHYNLTQIQQDNTLLQSMQLYKHANPTCRHGYKLPPPSPATLLTHNPSPVTVSPSVTFSILPRPPNRFSLAWQHTSTTFWDLSECGGRRNPRTDLNQEFRSEWNTLDGLCGQTWWLLWRVGFKKYSSLVKTM